MGFQQVAVALGLDLCRYGDSLGSRLAAPAGLGGSSAPTLTSLALATRAVQGSDPTTYPREFTVSSLNPPDATTYYVFLGVPIYWTGGSVTITSVPEPSTLTLAALGVLIVAGVRSRRRRARTTA